MREPSLFRRLFVTTTGLLILLFFVATIIFVRWEYFSLRYNQDKELVTDAHILWKLTEENMGTDKKMGEIDFNAAAPNLNEKYRQALSQYTQWRSFRIWKQDKLMLKSGTAEAKNVPEAQADFSEKEIGEDTWRTYALYISDEDIVIEMSGNLREIDTLMANSLRGIFYIYLVILPLLILAIFISLRYGLQGVTKMADHLRLRNPEDLQNVSIPTLPKELKPLQNSLNFLLDRLKNVLMRERQLIDNAAHELRTPLAGIQLHAQLAAEASDPKDRAESMDELFIAIKRANGIVEQLLALSRISAENVVKEQILVYPIIKRVLADRAIIAAEKGISLSLSGNENTQQLSHASLIAILIGVLLDNAIKFTPDHGKVSVRVSDHMIDVHDTGPGIPAAEREKVFERFYRGKSHTTGSGLGLAIARQICLLLDIGVELSEPGDGHGLLVRLTFVKNSVQIP